MTDSVTVATAGIGSYSHLSAVWFNSVAGVKSNLVPYNSNSPYADLLAGQIQLMFDGDTYALKQWVVTDAQGMDTSVSLSDINTTAKLDDALFKVTTPRWPTLPGR